MRIERVDSMVHGDGHFVAVHTDTGLTGYGQSGCWGYPTAVAAVIDTFGDHLVGKDPWQREHHWQHLYRMAPFRGSILMAAVSAIDIALWDLAGKALGVPVWQLLGGSTRDRIRLHRLLAGSGPDALAAEAREVVADGFTAVKFDPFPADYGDLPQAQLVSRTVETVAAVRETVGEEVDILIELHRKLTPLQAQAVVPRLVEFNPLAVEDAIQIDSVTEQATIARQSYGAPFANGERFHSIWEFTELLNQGGPQFVRPDLGLAGGISHVKKIAAIAEARHAAVMTHNCLGPLLTLASVHVMASIPNFVTQEYSWVDDELLDGPFVPCVRRDGGHLPLPTEPGIGVTHRPGDWQLDLVGRAIPDIPMRADGSVAYSV
ncbi:mandelate racemase/muconate lactonizing enzyme family protein [Propionibacteriaceae bacterium Y2011]|uniref:mandelate racemase/muconate lactonizing enzyme family protein n=1 Tax=Microlunatus sp. Y2014 TaxID=3418488 RepID=UPI003B441DFD